MNPEDKPWLGPILELIALGKTEELAHDMQQLRTRWMEAGHLTHRAAIDTKDEYEKRTDGRGSLGCADDEQWCIVDVDYSQALQPS